MEWEEYFQKRVFTASLRDVLAIHGESIDCFKPCSLQSDYLYNFVHSALEKNCEYVSDLHHSFALLGNGGSTHVYLGVGLIRKDQTI